MIILGDVQFLGQGEEVELPTGTKDTTITCIRIIAESDRLIEPNETVPVQIDLESLAPNDIVLEPSQVNVIIIDEDGMYTMTSMHLRT